MRKSYIEQLDSARGSITALSALMDTHKSESAAILAKEKKNQKELQLEI